MLSPERRLFESAADVSVVHTGPLLLTRLWYLYDTRPDHHRGGLNSRATQALYRRGSMLACVTG